MKSAVLTANDTIQLIESVASIYEDTEILSQAYFENNFSTEVDGYVTSDDLMIRYDEYLSEHEGSPAFETLQQNPLFEGRSFYIPFYDTHEGQVLISFWEESMVNASKFEALDENGQRIKLSTDLDENQMHIFIVPDDIDAALGLPWRRCYCTRGRNENAGPQNGGTSTRGVCEAGRNDEHCGQCARADFGGNCPGGTCPGC